MLRFASCVIIFSLLSTLINADDPCKVTDSVQGTIDISSLSNTDGKAKFADLFPTSGGTNWKYSFNPCQPFSEGDTCTGVAVCQVEATGTDTHVLAKQDSATWDLHPPTTTNPVLKYQYNGDTGQKNVEIEMICDQGQPGSLEAVGEMGTGFYQFKLTSKCACWNTCKGQGPPTPTPTPGGGPSSFPIGAIFIIILVALAVIYLTVFALYSRFRLQQSGRDLIAHRTFWAGLPGHAKDGVLFVVRRGKTGQYNSV